MLKNTQDWADLLICCDGSCSKMQLSLFYPSLQGAQTWNKSSFVAEVASGNVPLLLSSTIAIVLLIWCRFSSASFQQAQLKRWRCLPVSHFPLWIVFVSLWLGTPALELNIKVSLFIKSILSFSKAQCAAALLADFIWNLRKVACPQVSAGSFVAFCSPRDLSSLSSFSYQALIAQRYAFLNFYLWNIKALVQHLLSHAGIDYMAARARQSRENWFIFKTFQVIHSSINV